MLSRFEKFICGITEIDLYWHRLASGEMKRYGLKGNYAIYFTKLYGSPGGITSAQLATVCGKDKADVSRDIAALEQSGLVKRVCSSGSAYRAKIVLTEQGKQLTEKVVRKAELAVNCIGHDLKEEERQCFYRVLDTIITNMRELSETGLPDDENDIPEQS